MATNKKIWRVVHHWNHPKHDQEEFYSTFHDAKAAATSMESGEYDDAQFSEIENTVTGRRGSRRWGRKKIVWDRGAEQKTRERPLPPDWPTTEGIQLAFAVSGLPDGPAWDPAYVSPITSNQDVHRALVESLQGRRP